MRQLKVSTKKVSRGHFWDTFWFLANHIKPNEQGIRLHDDVYVYLLEEVPVARVFESVNMTHTAVTASPWHTALIKLTIPPRMNGRTSSLGNLSQSGPN